MPFFYDLPEGEAGRSIAEGLLRLRNDLDHDLPMRTREDTLLLATWNIREFDAPAYGARMDDAMFYIAEIVSRFDLVAVQEVHRSLDGLERLRALLGPWWRYLVTDVTEGNRGNDERMAFLYDSRKVRFSGLAGEVVIPPTEIREGRRVLAVNPSNQLWRTPYVAGFQAGWFRFSLATVHILYGSQGAESPQRIAEIRSVADFMARRVEDPDAWTSNAILLGDFNIFSRDDTTFAAITSAGFEIPVELQSIPGSNVAQNKAYDQIAFSRSARAAVECRSAGVFDFYRSVYRDQDEAQYVTAMGDAYHTTSSGSARADPTRYYKTYWRTHQMSDHLPMWVELGVDFGERYLRSVTDG